MILSMWSGQTFTDPRDGQKYKLAKIGNQIWMAENLRFVAPGSCCCRETDPTADLGKAKGKGIVALRSAVPNQKSRPCCREYGRLYNWQMALASAPPGWHLPTDKEWDELVQLVGGPELAGKQLKPGGSVGFNVQLAGRGYPFLTSYPNEHIVTVLDVISLKANTTFWSSTQLPGRWQHEDHATRHVLEFYQVYTYTLGQASVGVSQKLTEDYRFYSVRCIKD